MEERIAKKSVRIILTGKTGVGKSSVSNFLFGHPVFDAACTFSSVTKCSQRHSQIIRGTQFTAIDTPGFYDTSNNVDIDSEIENCIELSIPGPHVIVNVVRIGRLTEEDFKSVTLFIEKFGNEVQKYSLLVLTRFDDYKRDFGTEDFNFDNFISGLPERYQLLFKNTFENRYMPFDNTLTGSSALEQESKFMQKINEIIAANGNKNYTNDDFQKAVIADQNKKEEQRQKEKREKEDEEERIRLEEREKNTKKHQHDFEEFKKQLETETQQKQEQQEKVIQNIKNEMLKEIEELKAKHNDNSMSPMEVFRGLCTLAEFGNTACSLSGTSFDKVNTTDKTTAWNSKPATINSKSTTTAFPSATNFFFSN